MGRRNLAIPVKLWELACTIIGISLTADTLLTCVLTVAGFIYLGVQRNWRFLRSMAAFYAALGILLYLIRFHDFHPAVFSEFYVLMFWNLTPVFLVSWDLMPRRPESSQPFCPVSTRRVLSFWACWSCSVFSRL